MQILNVSAKNFKGIKLVEVQPQKTTTIVGGKNRAGKSSLLDAIASTLGGAKLCPPKPIRDGEEEAECSIKLDGDQARMMPPCTVVRKWARRKNGSIKSELEITTEDGYRAPTPQTILNDVVGPLGFDPERFLRMKPKEQADILRELVGLDFSELNKDRQKLYDERTAVNKAGKAKKARFDAMPVHDDAPEEEVSVSALMDELQRRQMLNEENDNLRKKVAESDALVAECTSRVEKLKKELQTAQDELEKAQECNQQDRHKADGLKNEDVAEIQQQISESETVNRKVRENAERARIEAELEAERKKSAKLTKQIEAIDAKKQKMQAEAQWPVDGLGYDDTGVTVSGRPLEQASSTEQREAAVGIVAALNPTLKFMMIKDGSLLDDESLVDFARIAAEKGFQLFVERVGEGDECTIVISDGEVKAE